MQGSVGPRSSDNWQQLQAAARCVDLEQVDHARDPSAARLDGLRLCARLLTIIVAARP
jgi:hypothetical protein